jgi:hypothetical protein
VPDAKSTLFCGATLRPDIAQEIPGSCCPRRLDEVATQRDGWCFRTSVEAPGGLRLTIGHTLSGGLNVEPVTLDGTPAEYGVVDTLRGREVRVESTTESAYVLVVNACRDRRRSISYLPSLIWRLASQMRHRLHGLLV